MDKLISVEHVTKKYDSNLVLDDISLDINKGDSIAFVGHNGCGKSTLIKIISGLVTYNSGSIVYNKKIKFNYVPDCFPKIALTPRQYILALGEIDGIKRDKIESVSASLFERLFMKGMIDIPIKHLSKGTMQKISVVQAMITKPDILLLDEPLSGQDDDSQRVFIDMVKLMNDNNVTVVMSCHEKWLISELSKQIYKIDKGKLVKVENSFSNTKNYVCLKFGHINPKIDKYQNVKLEDIAVKIDDVNGEKLIYVDQDLSDVVISRMISNGYGLRGMKNERVF